MPLRPLSYLDGSNATSGSPLCSTGPPGCPGCGRHGISERAAGAKVSSLIMAHYPCCFSWVVGHLGALDAGGKAYPSEQPARRFPRLLWPIIPAVSLGLLATWVPWMRAARHIRASSRREGFLAYYGPLSLLFL